MQLFNNLFIYLLIFFLIIHLKLHSSSSFFCVTVSWTSRSWSSYIFALQPQGQTVNKGLQLKLASYLKEVTVTPAESLVHPKQTLPLILTLLQWPFYAKVNMREQGFAKVLHYRLKYTLYIMYYVLPTFNKIVGWTSEPKPNKWQGIFKGFRCQLA